MRLGEDTIASSIVAGQVDLPEGQRQPGYSRLGSQGMLGLSQSEQKRKRRYKAVADIMQSRNRPYAPCSFPQPAAYHAPNQRPDTIDQCEVDMELAIH